MKLQLIRTGSDFFKEQLLIVNGVASHDVQLICGGVPEFDSILISDKVQSDTTDCPEILLLG